MLVLSRKASERINIGDEIVVEVRRVAGNRVTLAIEAPRSVRILRGELCQAAKEFEPQDCRDADASLESEAYIVTHQRFSAVESQHPSVS